MYLKKDLTMYLFKFKKLLYFTLYANGHKIKLFP